MSVSPRPVPRLIPTPGSVIDESAGTLAKNMDYGVQQGKAATCWLWHPPGIQRKSDLIKKRQSEGEADL